MPRPGGESERAQKDSRCCSHRGCRWSLRMWLPRARQGHVTEGSGNLSSGLGEEEKGSHDDTDDGDKDYTQHVLAFCIVFWSHCSHLSSKSTGRGESAPCDIRGTEARRVPSLSQQHTATWALEKGFEYTWFLYQTCGSQLPSLGKFCGRTLCIFIIPRHF